jgi:YHS domain-containing protein
MTRLLLLLAFFTALNLQAAEPAWQGYDPVAYFTRGAATPGDAAITLSFGGQTIRFATSGHRDLFRAAPDRYLPRYGGHCAMAMSSDHVIPADPRAFAILDGRLYLFSKSPLVEQFRREASRLIAEADRRWASWSGNPSKPKGKS